MSRFSPLFSLCLVSATVVSAQMWVEPDYVQTYSDQEISRQLKEIVETARQQALAAPPSALSPGDPLPPPEMPLLPSRVDNSHTLYSRSPSIDQGYSGSCGSASRIAHMFAHEINAYRGVDGSKEENMYPSFFTWLLTSQGSEKEQMAIFNGIPSAVTYGGNQISDIFHQTKIASLGWPTDANGAEYGWMQGYDRWKAAAGNRLEKTVDIEMGTAEKLEYVKWWFYNHHNDTTFSAGGILGGGVASSGWTESKIATGKYRAGEKIITAFGPTVDHGVVWSGYDDNIEFDLNGNGTIEADEKGAIIMLNSWGESWGNQGAAYIPYKLILADKKFAEFYYIRKDYRPNVMMKISMGYSQRNNLKLSIGIAPDANATEPAKTLLAHHFQYAGNTAIPMLGRWRDGVLHTEEMEFGFDLSDLAFGLDTRNPHRYFLIVETASGATGIGQVSELAAVQYSYHSKGEKATYDSTIIAAASLPVSISGGSQKIFIPIDLPANPGARPDFLYIPQSRLSVAAYSSHQQNLGEGANNVLDGNPSTHWHTIYSGETAPLPHQITIEVDSLYLISGLEYLPRQSGTNGTIGKYEIYVSNSPDNLGILIASGEFEPSKTAKQIFFEPTEGRFVTLRSITSAFGDSHCSAAEINLFASLEPDPSDPSAIAGAERILISPQVIRIAPHTYRVEAESDASWKLYRWDGQLLQSRRGTGIVDLNGSAPGLYLLRFHTSTESWTHKILHTR